MPAAAFERRFTSPCFAAAAATSPIAATFAIYEISTAATVLRRRHTPLRLPMLIFCRYYAACFR